MTDLSGSVGCTSDWWRGSWGCKTCRVGNTHLWSLIMKYFLRSFSFFCWFKKDNCQFMAKEYAQSGLPLSGRTALYYTLRLPPDVQIELQRRTADFRNFFCPSEIDTRDVQILSKGPPTFNQLYDVCPAYLPEICYLCCLSFKDVPLSACGSFIDSRVERRGTLLMAAWSLRVFVTRAD